MTSKPEKYGMSEGQKLAVFSGVGAIAGVVLVAFYLDLEMWGRVGMVLVSPKTMLLL